MISFHTGSKLTVCRYFRLEGMCFVRGILSEEKAYLVLKAVQLMMLIQQGFAACISMPHSLTYMVWQHWCFPFSQAFPTQEPRIKFHKCGSQTLLSKPNAIDIGKNLLQAPICLAQGNRAWVLTPR